MRFNHIKANPSILEKELKNANENLKSFCLFHQKTITTKLLYQHQYYIPKNSSTEEIIRLYENAFKNSQLELRKLISKEGTQFARWINMTGIFIQYSDLIIGYDKTHEETIDDKTINRKMKLDQKVLIHFYA